MKIEWGIIKKAALITSGSLSLGLGVLGIFLPILPTTPFLLLSAACYANSSKKFHRWLLGNKVFGKYIKDYKEKRGLTLKTKITAITVLWLTISCSAFFAVDIIWVKFLLFLVAIGVTIHLIYIKTIKP
ncbi:MAG: YbaN family protein [Candidatus Humimicrobiaceae bacterium]